MGAKKFMRAKKEIMDTRKNRNSRRKIKTENLENQRVCGEELRDLHLFCSNIWRERTPPKLFRIPVIPNTARHLLNTFPYLRYFTGSICYNDYPNHGNEKVTSLLWHRRYRWHICCAFAYC